MDVKHIVVAMLGALSFFTWAFMVYIDMATPEEFVTFVQFIASSCVAIALKEMR